MIDGDPYQDPSLWFLAWDGDQPAGIIFGYNETDDDTDMGWIHTVGVRRVWRRRGVGQALLQRMFCELYKRAGMHVERIMHSFELELREGKTLSRQSID